MKQQKFLHANSDHKQLLFLLVTLHWPFNTFTRIINRLLLLQQTFNNFLVDNEVR